MKRRFIVYILIIIFALSTFGCASEKSSKGNVQDLINNNTVSQNNKDISKEPSGNADKDLYAEALETAKKYSDLYNSIYGGDGFEVNLTNEQMNEIVSFLGSEGYAAADVSGNFDLTNGQLVSKFFDDMKAVNSAELTIYQICLDAGFVQHKISFEPMDTYVEITRLAWLQEGPFALAGDIPTVTRSAKFKITDIKFSDGDLVYEYFMPDNPEGGNHDGHVDTVETIRVTR